LAGAVTRVSVFVEPQRGHGTRPRPTTRHSLPRSRMSAARSISMGVRLAFTSSQYREGEPHSEHQPKSPWPCWWSLPSV
jgi:hypothetical protein